jgi:hypothetical protein
MGVRRRIASLSGLPANRAWNRTRNRTRVDRPKNTALRPSGNSPRDLDEVFQHCSHARLQRDPLGGIHQTQAKY